MRVPSLHGVSARLRDLLERRRQSRFHATLRRAGVELGAGCHVARGSEVSRKSKFGRGTRLNEPCVLKGSEPISFGNYCAVGGGARFISSNHRTDYANLQISLHRRLGLGPDLNEARGPIEIGHNVWVGDAAIVLSGVRVGDGAVVAAGAVVTHDVPAFAIVAGAPARVVRMRFSEAAIAKLRSLAWWDWPEERIRERADLFGGPFEARDQAGALRSPASA